MKFKKKKEKRQKTEKGNEEWVPGTLYIKIHHWCKLNSSQHKPQIFSENT